MTELGFGSAPRARYIFANRSAGTDTWYMLDREGVPVECPTNALTGHIVNLEFKQLERRGSLVWKLHLTIEADARYVIESGKDTVFARCVMSALAVLTKQQLSQPITVEVRPADRNAESLFCNFYLAGERVRCYWDRETQWRSVAQAAVSLFLDEPELQPVARPVAQLQPIAMDRPIDEYDDIVF